MYIKPRGQQAYSNTHLDQPHPIPLFLLTRNSPKKAIPEMIRVCIPTPPSNWKAQAWAAKLENGHRQQVSTPSVCTHLPGACQQKGWDAHSYSPWQQVGRAGHCHWHRHWKKVSIHLRQEKHKQTSSLTGSTHWLPTNSRVPVLQGTKGKKARKAIPAEGSSGSRPVRGARRMKTKREKQNQLCLREASMRHTD